MSKGRKPTTNRLRIVEADYEEGPAVVPLHAREAGNQASGVEGKPKSSPEGNLPLVLTSFVGREREITEIESSLVETRLLTLVGPGGCGKTRLALSVATGLEKPGEGFAGGAWWVGLSSLSDPGLVPNAVASALGVRETLDRTPTEALSDHLRSRKLLLVLDNCEHLIEACADLAGWLLTRCPELKILATSREPLDVAGEVSWSVPPLSLPNPGQEQTAEDLLRLGSVRLFVERTRAASPGFVLTEDNAPAVSGLCVRLDGMPLAIELAAARTRVLSPGQILARLDDRFRLLRGGRSSASRHRSLGATIDWSHDLLTREEKILFRRLSVFAGGFTLEAAEAACAGGEIEGGEVLELLSSLVDKSLVLAGEHGGEARYRLLETVRRYVQEKLDEAGEAPRTRRRHATFFLELAERAEPELTGARQGLWVDRLETERDNLRAAMGWSLEEEPEVGLRLAGALLEFCYIRGYYGEGREWLEGALGGSGGSSPALRAKALAGAGTLDFLQCEYDRATDELEESLTLYKELEDGRGIASALQSLGSIARERGHYARAEALTGESLVLQRALGNEEGIARSLDGLGFAAWLQGDPDRAWALCSEALNLYRSQEDAEGIAWSLVNLGAAAQYQSDLGQATTLLEESLALSRETGYKEGVAWSLNLLGIVAQRQGDHERAESLLKESFALHRDLGDKWRASSVLEGLAGSTRKQSSTEHAARLLGAAEGLREEISTPLPPCERPDHDRNVAALGAEMGEDAFVNARLQGRAHTPERVLAEEGPAALPATPPTGLTAREVEVLGLVARGLNDPEVAERLYISRRTVNAHMRSIYHKLGVSSRTAATRFAVENDIL